MAVSLTPMELTALSNFLQGLSEYNSVAAAATSLGLTGTEGAGFAGVAYQATGGAAAATSSTQGLTEIITLTQASNLEATGVKIGTSGIGLTQTGTGFKATAVLGVKLPIVAAAVAPLLGVSLGVDLYRKNPSLWKKISMTLLPFCYDKSDVVPTWADVYNDSWTVSIFKGIVEALKNLFLAEGIPMNSYDFDNYETENGVIIDGTIFGAPHVYNNLHYGQGAEYFAWVRNWKGIAFSRSYFDGASLESTYGYYYREYGYPLHLSDATVTMLDAITSTLDVTRGIASILGLTPQEFNYPDGTSKWNGTTPTEIPESNPAVTKPDGTTTPMTPISIPYEVPEISPTSPSVPSPDPEEQPDPTVTDEPEKQVSPYIQPYPVPWDVIYPYLNPDPEADPSQEPAKPLDNPDIPETVLPDIFPTGQSPTPTFPTTDIPFDGNGGIVTVYHPTSAQLYSFEQWLWVTLSQASINTVWNNPFDGVIGLFELYCTPTDVGTRNIHSGFLDSGINSNVISRYTEINCGTLGIPEYYGNYFDYSPYSKAHIYLPFIGIQELNVDDIVGHVVNVTYRIDEYNGSCIAMITIGKDTVVNGVHETYINTMYQFCGNCAVELPISGGSQASILAGQMTANAYQNAANIAATGQMIGGLASIIGGIIGLNAGSIGSGVSSLVGAKATQAYGQAQALSNMLSGKSTVQKSGQFGSSHGALGIKNPFITIIRPKQIQVPNYNELYGYPAHKRLVVGQCTGFIRCREVHVISAQATDEEKATIESMMKSGVYVTE